ncbi:MAG TPA: NADH-quinone oxidoreductase subunit NuoN [Alphaproteobacteria bacterium]
MTEISLAAPEILLALGTMAMMVVGAFLRGGALKPVAILTLILWLVSLVYIWINGASLEAQRAFSDMFIADGFGQVMKSMIVMGSAAALLISLKDLEGTIMARFEYPVLMGFSMLGMFLMISANDFLALYVGLELSSLALYVMAAFNRNTAKSSEAGLKYFVLGAISSGLLLFGISLIYGFTGSTQFDVVGATLSAASVPAGVPVVVLFGMVLVLAGLAFKISAVPFHMWTPDVYDGAPTSVTAFFAIVPKVAAMALIVRLVMGPFEDLVSDWQPVLVLMAALSMTVGALAAIVQKNLKRLLAYSSIGNMGYALIGVAVGTAEGITSMIVYLSIYMVMTAGTFGIIMALRKSGFAVDQISDLSGLSKTKPGIAYGLAAIMFSLSGIPPLAGFFGKLYVFQSAVAAHAYVLAVFGVITSVVAAWYYLNIIRTMFFESAENLAEPVTVECDAPLIAVVTLSLLFIVGFIVMPGQWLSLAHFASAGLMP